MQVQELMTRDVKLINPGTPISEAARMMASEDVGSLPVGENDRLVGMVTDRDIVTRCLAQGKDGNTDIGSVMSKGVAWCYDDQSDEDASRIMAQHQVRRLPVVNHDKRLVGLISLGDLSAGYSAEAGETLEEIFKA